MGRCAAQHLREVHGIRRHAARDERGSRAQREGERVERPIDGPVRARLRLLPQLAGRRRLPLRQSVDAIVEEQDLQIDIAAQGVDEVVAADGKPVAVAGHHEDRQLGPRHLEARRDGRSAAVDAVYPVSVHVVGKAARAADAADEHDVLLGHVQLGHHLLHGGEDGEVGAAGAPAHFLIADEIFLGQVQLAAHAISLARGASFSIALRTSATWKGFPCTLLRPTVSMPS